MAYPSRVTRSCFPQLPQAPDPAASAWRRIITAIGPTDLGKVPPRFQGFDVAITADSQFFAVEAKAYRVGVAWRAQNLVASWGSNLRDLHGQRFGDAEALTHLLLRTTEKDSGLPSATSGLMHGLRTASDCAPAWVIDGQHRLASTLQTVYAATGSGKSAALAWLVAELGLTLGEARHTGSTASTREISLAADYAPEPAHAASQAEKLVEFLRELTQEFLSSIVQHSRYHVAVPAHQSSPCGVLRLAAPIIPGAPNQGPATVPTDLALAA